MYKSSVIHIISSVIILCISSGCSQSNSVNSGEISGDRMDLASVEDGSQMPVQELCRIIDGALSGAVPYDALEVATAERLIGDWYSSFADFDSAKEWYRKSYGRLKEAGIDSLCGSLAFSIVNCDVRLKDKEEAFRTMALLRNELSGRTDPSSIYMLEFSEGLTESEFGSPDAAAHNFEKALSVADSVRSREVSPLPPMLMLVFHRIESGEPVEALRLLDAYRETAYPKASLNYKADYMKAYTRVFTMLNMLDSASVYQDRYFILIDSLRKGDGYRLLDNEVKTIDALYKKRHSQRNTVLYLTVGLMALLSAVVIPIQTTLRKRRAMRNLTASDLAMVRLQNHNVSASPSQSSTQREQLFLRVRAVVELPENFSNPDLSLPRVAEVVGVNVKYVSDSIKESTGYSFRQFVNSYRIGEARRLLLDETIVRNLTIQSIAEKVGFKSSSAFISWFRQFTGMTPSMYVRLSRHEELRKSKK